jgi:hypothetical protein
VGCLPAGLYAGQQVNEHLPVTQQLSRLSESKPKKKYFFAEQKDASDMPP